MKRLHVVFAMVVVLSLLRLLSAAELRREIQFPDPPGYQTLKCDLHMHTVFSDGNVWPTVRTDEAWRLGLDAVAVTDHIEYLPHKDDVPTNHNRPYFLAAGPARERNLLLPRGAEITRDTPPGHFNAIFLRDIAPLDTAEFLDAVKKANEQGAFVFWNHQGWKGEERGRWLEVHETLHRKKWLHGMEVCNGDSYYPTAHRWCLEKNLTMLGGSDIHGPDLRERNLPGDHRTMTLVFVKERTIEALKDALTRGRTAVWFQGQLIGKRQWLEPLFQACVKIEPPHLRTKDALWVCLRNTCDLDIHLKRTGGLGPAELTLPARTTSLVKISTKNSAIPITLAYLATNWVVAPETGLPVTLRIAGP